MDKIYVTKTFLPPLEEYEAFLKQIWASHYVTNTGPLVIEFEKQAKEYLGVENFHFVTNGTLALQLALRAIDVEGGEVITTPFSYVATTSAIMWERCQPVFVDIDPETFCLDATKIEAVITDRTKAIMPVHVFGNPCDVEAIETIAKRYNLKVIYDAAHSFGVKYKGKSLISYGDISTCSFHATKPFHTIEGGAVIIKDKKLSDEIELMKRFGHNSDEHFRLGINAKASEFQAAMGLVNLNYIDQIIAKRKAASELYDKLLAGRYQSLSIRPDTQYNYAYYPIVLDSENQLMDMVRVFESQNIFPRRYFYPSLNTLPYVKSKVSCPVSEDTAKRILCLPLYGDLSVKDVERISKVLTK